MPNQPTSAPVSVRIAAIDAGDVATVRLVDDAGNQLAAEVTVAALSTYRRLQQALAAEGFAYSEVRFELGGRDQGGSPRFWKAHISRLMAKTVGTI